jgi:hypothetical protein
MGDLLLDISGTSTAFAVQVRRQKVRHGCLYERKLSRNRLALNHSLLYWINMSVRLMQHQYRYGICVLSECRHYDYAIVNYVLRLHLQNSVVVSITIKPTRF